MAQSKKASLEKLYLKIDSCKNCGFKCTVPKIRCKYGSEQSGAILIVGQNPSSRQVPSCVHPWGGLDIFSEKHPKIHKYSDITEIWLKDAWITNMIKCITPKDKKIHSVEIKACSCWLEQEIQIINPSKIIALGDFAGQWLEKSEYRDIVVRFKHPNFINQWHPEKTVKYLAELKNILIG